MTEPIRFKDTDSALLDWLKATFPELADRPGGPVDEHVGTETPKAGARPGLVDRLPFALLEGAGGSDNFFSDYPIYWILVFGRRRADAYDLIEAIRARLLAAPLVAGGVVIDTVDTRTRPQRLTTREVDDTVCWGASFQLGVRRR